MPLKVLDYGRKDPFRSRIGKPRHLAWPVNAYRVTLPKGSADVDHVNPFDRVVLKLLAAMGQLDAKALSYDTCIPVDLVNGILLRLKDRGIIDDSHSVRDLSDDGSSEEDPPAPVFVTAVVFRELITGKILPFIRPLDDQSQLKLRDDERVRRKILQVTSVHQESTPTPRDVINAHRGMHKRVCMDGIAAALPSAQMIMVSPKPALYYLDCPIAITRQDGDFRIADPFGEGFSLTLETAFTQLLERDQDIANWLRDWKDSLRNPRPREPDTSGLGVKEPFDTDANWQRYPRLLANLRPAENETFRSLSKIYACIEWSLFYSCSRRPFEKAIALLTFANPVDHSALLADAARCIGLRSPAFGFRAIPQGKLLDFRTGKAELGTVLALSLLQAAQDHSHPIRNLGAQHPDVIDLVLTIKKRRDDKGHGQGPADAPEVEQASDHLMREVVHALLPDIWFGDTPERPLHEDLRGDSLLEARGSIQDEFGFRAFNRLGANVQERLVHAERYWQSRRDGDDALGFANDLYGAVQAVMKTALAGRLPPEVSDAEFHMKAQENAVAADLCKELPACLRTVKALAIRQTLEGAAQTLGSCVIAFLLVSTQDTLRAITEAQPSFINDIELILTCRKHGNEPLPLSKPDTEHLRRASFATIRTLIGA
jgi:hypothetical protein